VSTLADLVHDRTDLDDGDLGHLQRLVAEWQLIADLSFADLVLWVRTREGCWVAAALMRPTTGPTVYPDDVVGLELKQATRLERAWSSGRIGRETEPEWAARVPVRQEAVPVRRGGRAVAVLSRDSPYRECPASWS